MLNSNERMGFIIEYMSSYDEKIKMANKNGLFDAAKMFELFAIEVCNVWFGQKFSNLNDETATYPYVDLISENRELLVQVSTVQDVPTKIKTTLEKIRDSKDKKCSDLKNIVFFVLSNNSIDKVREYSGDNQIGSISFTIKDNLITTNDIITSSILRKRMRCSKRDDIFGSTYVILCKGCCWKSRYNRSCLRFRK